MKGDRRQQMMEYFLSHTKATTQEVSDYFNISIETVRRDFSGLEKEGFLKRVHGGAILNRNNRMPAAMAAWNVRMADHLREKQAIAHEALKYIPDGSTIALDSGTTMQIFAEQLAERKELTVITNCMHVANVISMHTPHAVYMIGGLVKRDELITTGYLADDFLRHFSRVDLAIIATDGFDAKLGPTDHSAETSMIKRSFIQKANKTLCLIDHSKFSINALFTTLSNEEQLDLCITDSLIQPEELERLRSFSRQVVVVDAIS